MLTKAGYYEKFDQCRVISILKLYIHLIFFHDALHSTNIAEGTD